MPTYCLTQTAKFETQNRAYQYRPTLIFLLIHQFLVFHSKESSIQWLIRFYFKFLVALSMLFFCLFCYDMPQCNNNYANNCCNNNLTYFCWRLRLLPLLLLISAKCSSRFFGLLCAACHYPWTPFLGQLVVGPQQLPSGSLFKSKLIIIFISISISVIITAKAVSKSNNKKTNYLVRCSFFCW